MEMDNADLCFTVQLGSISRSIGDQLIFENSHVTRHIFNQSKIYTKHTGRYPVNGQECCTNPTSYPSAVGG